MNLRRGVLGLAHLGYDGVRAALAPVAPAVRIMLVDGDRVLLVYHSYLPYWYFPGGGMKQGETLVEAAKREAYEETGAIVCGEPWLLGVYLMDYRGRSDHIAVFVAEQFDLAPATDRWEIMGKAFFALDKLPPDMARSCRRRVTEYVRRERVYFGVW